MLQIKLKICYQNVKNKYNLTPSPVNKRKTLRFSGIRENQSEQKKLLA